MPRLHRAWQEVAYAPALTVAPDQSGVCGEVSCPAPRGPSRLGRTCRACGLRAGDALPLAGGARGLHQPRPSWRAGTVKLVLCVTVTVRPLLGREVQRGMPRLISFTSCVRRKR